MKLANSLDGCNGELYGQMVKLSYLIITPLNFTECEFSVKILVS